MEVEDRSFIAFAVGEAIVIEDRIEVIAIASFTIRHDLQYVVLHVIEIRVGYVLEDPKVPFSSVDAEGEEVKGEDKDGGEFVEGKHDGGF